MPRGHRNNYDIDQVVAMREQGLSYRLIAQMVGASGESTIREAIRRHSGQPPRDASRSLAASIALAARWNTTRPAVGARTFGVEIEFHTAIRSNVADAVGAVVGYHIHMTGYHGNTCYTCGGTVSGYQHWKLETDSSATSGMANAGPRPNNQGGELVSPVLAGEAGLEEVRKVMQALRSVNAKVDRRHGMHVHLGVADITGDNRARLFTNYKQMQKTLFKLVATYRQHNHYCTPVSAMRLDDWANASRFSRGISGSHSDAMNVENIRRIGTIEMRMHQGTLNGKKATEWVKLLVAFFDASLNGVVIDLNDDPITVLKDSGYITGASAEWLIRRQETLYPNAVVV